MLTDDPETTVALVIDDDEFVRKALGRNLRRLGCEVLISTSGEEGLTLAVEAQPMVIFLDLRMPGMDGHAVLRRLFELDVQASVIAMSGQGDMDDVIEAMRQGAIDYVKKPWTTNELVSALSRGVQVFRSRADHAPARTASTTRVKATNGAPGPTVGSSARDALPGGPAPAEGRTAAPLREIVDWLRSGDLPAIPFAPALTRLRQLALETAPSVDEVARVVECDATLATTLLRLANSSLHGPGHAVGDPRAAIARVGVRQVHCMAETIALRDAFHIDDGPAQARQETIWRFSVARALAMRAIADVTGPEVGLDGDRCYLAGLLLDVGASFLFWTLAERSGPVARPGGRTEGPSDRTLAEVRAYHAAFGQALIAGWGLWEQVATLAGEHHAETSPVAQSALWCAAVTAGPLASRLAGGSDLTHDRPPRPELLDRCAHALGLGETALRRLALGLAADARELWAVYA